MIMIVKYTMVSPKVKINFKQTRLSFKKDRRTLGNDQLLDDFSASRRHRILGKILAGYPFVGGIFRRKGFRSAGKNV